MLEVASTDAVFAVNPETVGQWTTIPAYPFLGRTFETIELPGAPGSVLARASNRRCRTRQIRKVKC